MTDINKANEKVGKGCPAGDYVHEYNKGQGANLKSYMRCKLNDAQAALRLINYEIETSETHLDGMMQAVSEGYLEPEGLFSYMASEKHLTHAKSFLEDTIFNCTKEINGGYDLLYDSNLVYDEELDKYVNKPK